MHGVLFQRADRLVGCIEISVNEEWASGRLSRATSRRARRRGKESGSKGKPASSVKPGPAATFAAFRQD
jgi:hypothetical protein